MRLKREKMEKGEKKYKYIYGPVPSRRLGMSLGIDIILYKVCTYDCIYCQLGRTAKKTGIRKEYVPTENIIKEIEQKLSERIDYDYITLAGSGEPTLNSGLKQIIEYLKSRTQIPVAVLTNGSLLFLDAVIESLLQADLIIPSLDAGSKELFLKVNRPIACIDYLQMINGLMNFSKIYNGQLWLEIMVLKNFTDTDEEIKKIANVVAQFKVDKVQLNTVLRPPSEKYAKPVGKKRIKELTKYFECEVEIVGKMSKKNEENRNYHIRNLEDRILSLIKRRPVTIKDISIGLSITPNEATKIIPILLEKEEIGKEFLNGKVYYKKHETEKQKLLR